MDIMRVHYAFIWHQWEPFFLHCKKNSSQDFVKNLKFVDTVPYIQLFNSRLTFTIFSFLKISLSEEIYIQILLHWNFHTISFPIHFHYWVYPSLKVCTVWRDIDSYYFFVLNKFPNTHFFKLCTLRLTDVILTHTI